MLLSATLSSLLRKTAKAKETLSDGGETSTKMRK